MEQGSPQRCREVDRGVEEGSTPLLVRGQALRGGGGGKSMLPTEYLYECFVELLKQGSYLCLGGVYGRYHILLLLYWFKF